MRKLLPVLLFVSSFTVAAQTPHLVKDINTTQGSPAAGSSAFGFAPFGNLILFNAITEATGEEPYVTDGNSGATLLANPPGGWSRPTGFTGANTFAIFAATDGTHGIELWATDGTPAGTHQLMDINPGTASSSPSPIGVVNNKVLFAADDGVHGRELWVTDGTTAGTRLLRDIDPGKPASAPSAGAAFKNAVYFGAFDGGGGLWKSDGTDAGTVKVANNGAAYPVVAGSQLFFAEYTPENGAELWVSDGTTAGTHIVLDINSGTADAFHSQYDTKNLTAVGNRLFFLADDGVHGREMWVSDGTAAGTHMIRDFVPGPTGMWDAGYAGITALGGRAFFTVTDPVHGTDVWVTDGTDGGTGLFFAGTSGSLLRELTSAGGNLFFIAAKQLWVSDGSAASTHTVGNPASGPVLLSSASVHLTPIGDKIYFDGYAPLAGDEPWVSDGTAAGTHMIANIGVDGIPSSSPAPIFGSDTLLFFNASTPDLSAGIASTVLWRSDGTSSGTFSLGTLGDPPPPSVTPQPTVFFLNTDSSLNSQTLYASDGTPQGTRGATDIVQHFPNASANVRRLFLFGDRLYATLYDGTDGIPLLAATTTASGAPAVSLGIKHTDSMIDVAGRQFVETTDSGLWSTDGTAAGTHAIAPSAAPISNLANATGTVFYLQRSSGENTKLWKTDGTFDGTVVVKELTAADSQKQEIEAAGRRLYFTSGGALWTSDGTAAGTISLVTLPPFIASTDRLYPAGNSIVFIQSAVNGYEIWGSDGTQAGTKRLATSPGRYPMLATIEDRVYFSGYDASFGFEPWVTDGTPAGTRMLGDVNPGAASSNPAGFTKSGNAVFFSASDPTAGNELWAFPLTDERLSIDDVRVPEGGATAHFTVKLAPAANKSISVDYATSDGTAHAGSDYDSGNGTLTFAAGETSKTIDVRVHGNGAGGNPTFFVTLRNAGGEARVTRADAAGIIEDGTLAADLSLTHDIDSNRFGYVTILNHGPNAAIYATLTNTSAPIGSDCCINTATYPLIANGATALRWFSGPPLAQIYGSATVTAQQHDPNPADNSVSWTDNQTRTMSMTPAFLTAGASGRVTIITSNPSAGVTSSDPSVVSVPATVGSATSGVAVFNVTALEPGTSTVSAGSTSLLVTVVAPGTQPRWPGAIAVCCPNGADFARAVEVAVIPTATALFTGAKATGAFTVSAAGRELAHSTLNGQTVVLHLFLPVLGVNTIQVAYAGDANFLPAASSMDVNVGKGLVTLNALLEAVPGAPGSYQLKVDADGSPFSPPTGTLLVMNGSTQVASLTLTPTSGGTSAAQTVLANLSGSPTLTIQYAGDAFYSGTFQQVRALQTHRRAVHH